MPDGFTKLSKKVYSKKGEVKEGSLSIFTQRDCSIDKTDYCWHSLSTSEIEEERRKKKTTKTKISYTEHHLTELLYPVFHPHEYH